MPKSLSLSQLRNTGVDRRILTAKDSCSHQQMYIGLDAAYCADCGSEFSPRSIEYQLLVAPELESQKSCSGQNSKPCPEQLCPEQKHWVEVYSPSKRKGYSYYRYVWRDEGKLVHRHIKGGDIHSTSAIALKEIVEKAIASGLTPQEIEQLIKSSMRSPLDQIQTRLSN